jgi:hypothetical protein
LRANRSQVGLVGCGPEWQGAFGRGGVRCGEVNIGEANRFVGVFGAWWKMVRTGEARRVTAWRGKARIFTKGAVMNFEVDVENVEPGTTIEQSTVEQIIGIKRQGNEYDYQFALMQLGEFVQRSLWKIGKQYTVRTSNGEVQVLTHEEASRHNANKFDLRMEGMRRDNRRLVAVDVGALSKEAREDHGKAIIKQSRILSMLKTAKRELSLVAEQPKKPVVVIRKS